MFLFSFFPASLRFGVLAIQLQAVCNVLTEFQPFFNQVLAAGNSRLAAVFIPKCTGLEPGATVSMYERCGMRVKAAEEAVKIKDVESWNRLLDAAGRGTSEGREIERIGLAVFKR